MRNVGWGGLALSLLPAAAAAQSSYVGPDKINRFPAVTIFCPQGSGVVPCNFGGASGSSSLSVSGTAVSAGNPLPVTDSALDALIGDGMLSVGGSVVLAHGTNSIGTVSIGNFPSIQPVSGSLTVTSLPALPAGSNGIGSVAISNFPGTQAISGAVSQSGSWNLGVTSLPALPSGANAIGSVSVSNFPASQPVSGTVSLTGTPTVTLAGSNTVTLSSNTVTLAAGSSVAGTMHITGAVASNLQATASGGANSMLSLNAASSAMATNVKASAGMVYGYTVCNSNASSVYFRLFNLATAPTVGISTPLLVDIIPAGTCAHFNNELGLAYGSGIAFDVTSGSLSNGDTATIASANSVAVTMFTE